MGGTGRWELAFAKFYVQRQKDPSRTMWDRMALGKVVRTSKIVAVQVYTRVTVLNVRARW